MSESTYVKYSLPQCCCRCLGQAGKTMILSGGYRYDSDGVRHTRTFTLDVPICAQCRKSIYVKRLIGLGLVVLITFLGWQAGRFFWGEGDGPIWSAIGGFVIGVIAGFVLWFSSDPGEIKTDGKPFFKNTEFQTRFMTLNNIDPKSYEGLDEMLLDDQKLKQLDEALRARGSATTDVPIGSTPTTGQVVLEFGDGTSMLKFPEGSESKYRMHLKLTERLKEAGAYPALSVCGLKGGSNASCSRMILITGSTEEIQKLSQVFYSPAAESFVNEECGGDWDKVTAAATLSNYSEPGLSVGDLGPFNELAQEVRDGSFEFDTVLK